MYKIFFFFFCVQKRFLPAIYAQRAHLDPLDPVNPAPRGGLTGSKSEGSGSRFDQSKGCESSGSGGSGSRSYQSNMPLGNQGPKIGTVPVTGPVRGMKRVAVKFFFFFFFYFSFFKSVSIYVMKINPRRKKKAQPCPASYLDLRGSPWQIINIKLHTFGLSAFSVKFIGYPVKRP